MVALLSLVSEHKAKVNWLKLLLIRTIVQLSSLLYVLFNIVMNSVTFFNVLPVAKPLKEKYNSLARDTLR